jgi:hypothetical protein
MDQQKVEAFLKEYKELCDKYKMHLVVQPIYRATNHGTFELELEARVAEVISGAKEI